jgi:hypothetical protein
MNPIHTLQPYFPKIHFKKSSHLRLGLTSGHFPYVVMQPQKCHIENEFINGFAGQPKN